MFRFYAGTDHGHHQLDDNGHQQNRALDGIVDQSVHLQGGDDLVDDGIAHGAEQNAQQLASHRKALRPVSMPVMT